jgi:hypothetical protein
MAEFFAKIPDKKQLFKLKELRRKISKQFLSLQR